MKLDFNAVKTPCYLVVEGLLYDNLKILKSVSDRSGCKILLAQKAYSMFSTYPLIGQFCSGTTASSLFEARLGYEEMGGEVHIFAPAYREEDFDAILNYSDHIVFNSFNQWNRYRDRVQGFCKEGNKKIHCGIRINPEYSEIETDIYNPCFRGSRLGVPLSAFEEACKDEQALSGISGLHFHTLCEQNSDTLKRTIEVVDQKFGKYLKRMKWLNFGGGHHITRPDYDLDTLCSCIEYMKNQYDLQIYLEPGEAFALNTGFLVASVLDIVENGLEIAILDASAACHMPDVLEMPYRPKIFRAQAFDSENLKASLAQALNMAELPPLPSQGQTKPHSYRLGAHTCLAGDIIGDYNFREPLCIGDKLVFCDMAIYSMVKNNTFNGINLPSILLFSEEQGLRTVKEFTYEDFKSRLS